MPDTQVHQTHEAAPAREQAQPVPASRTTRPEKKKKRGCHGCLLYFLVAIVVLAAVAGGGYYAFLKGYVSQRTLLKIAGQAPGQVNVLNLSASDRVAFFALEAGTSVSFFETNTGTAQPSESTSIGGLKPGRYTVRLTSLGKTPKDVSCAIIIRNADVYRFIFSDGPVLVFRGDALPASKEDTDVTTSSLCKQ